MSQGARNWPFFTLIARPVRPAATSRSVWRQRKAGICSTSTASAAGAHWSGACTSVSVGRPGLRAHLGEDAEALRHADAARRGGAGAVGLVEAGFVDDGHAGGGGDFAQRRGDFQRMGAGFDLAGAGDQDERQVVGDGDVAHPHDTLPGVTDRGVAGCPALAAPGCRGDLYRSRPPPPTEPPRGRRAIDPRPNIPNMARPAGLEPATHSLEGVG